LALPASCRYSSDEVDVSAPAELPAPGTVSRMDASDGDGDGLPDPSAAGSAAGGELKEEREVCSADWDLSEDIVDDAECQQSQMVTRLCC